jgi:hypothetical protein
VEQLSYDLKPELARPLLHAPVSLAASTTGERPMAGQLRRTATKTILLVASLVLFTALIFGTDLLSPSEVPDAVAYAAMVLLSS